MSVINTMLQDLERRGANLPGAGDRILDGLSSNGRRCEDEGSVGKSLITGIIGVATVLAIVIVAYYFSPYQLVNVAQTQAVPAPSAAVRVDVAQSVKLPDLASTPRAEPVVRVAQQQVEKMPPLQKAEQSGGAPVVLPVTAASIDNSSVALSKPAEVQKPQVSKQAVAVTSKSRVADAETIQADDDVDDAAEDTDDSLLVVNKQQREFTPEEKSQQAYAAAMKFYGQGNRQESKSSLTQALSYSTSNPDVYRLLAAIYFEDGRVDLASDVIEKGLVVHADNQSLLRLELQALVEKKDYRKAIDVMEKRLKMTSPDDLGYLAGLYQKDNDHLNAVKTYAQALQLVPSKSIWWVGQGISLEVMKQYKEALQSYQKSISTGQLSGKLADYAITRMNYIKQRNADVVS